MFETLRVSPVITYMKMLFSWLPLMMPLVVTGFVMYFPTDCLEWDLRLNFVSSENFLTNLYITAKAYL